MRGRWLRVGVGLILALDLALVALGGWSVLQAPVVPLDVERGTTEGCAWSADGGCLTALGGIPVSKRTFVHPTELVSWDELAAWQEGQDALRAALPLGAPVSRVIDGELLEDRRVTERGLGSILSVFLPVSATAFLMVLMGTVVLLRGRGGPAAALFLLCQSALMCMVPEAVLILSAPVVSPVLYTLQHVALVGALSGVLALLYLAASFPQRLLPAPWGARLGWMTAGMAAGVVGLYALGVRQAPFLVISPTVLLAAIFLAVNMRKPGRQLHRLQAMWVLWGLMMPVLVWIPIYIASSRMGSSTLLQVLPLLSLIAIPAGISMAILRHELLGIRLILRRTLVGAGVFALAVFVFNLTVAGVAGSMTPRLGSGYEAILFTAVALSLMLTPIQTRMERRVDRLFLRNRFDYRRQLTQMPEHFSTIRSSEKLVGFALKRIGRVMELESVVMVFHPDFPGDRVWRFGRDAGVVSAPLSGQPWLALSSLTEPTLCRPDSPDAQNQWMAEESLEIVVPMRTIEGMMGVLLCSGLPGRRTFDSEDAAALTAAASGLALSLGHILSYERLEQLNDELEQRIEERTAALNAANVKLYSQEKMASLGVLAAGVAHELNTPIGVVQSTSEMLARALPPEARTARMATLCRDAARRAAEIVTDLRSFSRPELQGLEAVDLVESLETTLRLLSGRLRDAGITVERRFEAVPLVEGNPAMLNQTLSNLIRNAVQVMEPDGGTLTVAVRPMGPVVCISIADTGPGISDAIRSRIFEPFFTTRGPGEGTGLGLSLCFTFVAEHHGRIWEEGREGEGACFVVELPIRQPREEVVGE